MDDREVLTKLNSAIKATILAQLTVRHAFKDALKDERIEDALRYSFVDDSLMAGRELLTANLELVEGMERNKEEKHNDDVARLNRCLEKPSC
jgi:hypothetical protein